LSDDEVKSNVLKAFSDEPDLSGLNIDVQVVSGAATLHGTVSRQAQKVIASDAARSAHGVKQVVNKMTIEKKQDAPKEMTDKASKTASETKSAPADPAKKCWWIFCK
jgi:uncharacterized protein YqgV (UPF0045/DUF77 family)